MQKKGFRLQRTTDNQEQYFAVTTPPMFISKDQGGCDTHQSYIHTGLQAIKSTEKINDQKIPKIGGDNPIMNRPIQPQNTTKNSDEWRSRSGSRRADRTNNNKKSLR